MHIMGLCAINEMGKKTDLLDDEKDQASSSYFAIKYHKADDFLSELELTSALCTTRDQII